MRRCLELYLPIGPKCLDKTKDTKEIRLNPMLHPNPRFLNTSEEPEFLRYCVKKTLILQ